MTESKSDQVDCTKGHFVFGHAPGHNHNGELENPDMVMHVPAAKVHELFGTAVRSRDLLRRAVRDGNLAEIGFAFGWLDKTLTEAAQLLLPSSARKQMVVPMSGGGEKPTDPE